MRHELSFVLSLSSGLKNIIRKRLSLDVCIINISSKVVVRIRNKILKLCLFTKSKHAKV